MDKAHGWDQLSMRMVKVSGNSKSFVLKFIFKSMVHEGVFPKDWKKSNVGPIKLTYKSSPNIQQSL